MLNFNRFFKHLRNHQQYYTHKQPYISTSEFQDLKIRNAYSLAGDPFYKLGSPHCKESNTNCQVSYVQQKLSHLFIKRLCEIQFFIMKNLYDKVEQYSLKNCHDTN